MIRPALKKGMALVAVLALAWAGIVAAQATARVGGSWEIAWSGENGPETGVFVFAQRGKAVTGTFSNARVGAGTITGTVEGKALKFAITLGTPPDTEIIECTAEVDGANIKGIAKTGGGDVPWTGKKVPKSAPAKSAPAKSAPAKKTP